MGQAEQGAWAGRRGMGFQGWGRGLGQEPWPQSQGQAPLLFPEGSSSVAQGPRSLPGPA